MFEKLRAAVTGATVDLAGQHQFTRDIKARIAGGDLEAAAVFRTGTLAAALTERGREARGQEVVDYVQAVQQADGSADRVSWFFRR
ncbi:hypothetical protein [Kitasatospora sp. NPDC002040]|uniref:hypothetical protein n=1 Tax=Kitasatospora sp. NPDC002040 TaxID=3154661 RepID=UPI003324C90E